MQNYTENDVNVMNTMSNVKISDRELLKENVEKDIHGMDIMENVKSSDRGYAFVYRLKENASGKIKRSRVDLYTTEASNGSLIRNAETGQYYNDRVGSLNEYLYFKVAMSSGEVRSRNSSNILFYDSPNQYEQHLNGVVSDDVKMSWSERRDDYLRKRRSSRQST